MCLPATNSPVQVEQSRFVVRPYSMGEAALEEAETPRPTPRTTARCGGASAAARSAALLRQQYSQPLERGCPPHFRDTAVNS
jgi:hypothetical protein